MLSKIARTAAALDGSPWPAPSMRAASSSSRVGGVRRPHLEDKQPRDCAGQFVRAEQSGAVRQADAQRGRIGLAGSDEGVHGRQRAVTRRAGRRAAGGAAPPDRLPVQRCPGSPTHSARSRHAWPGTAPSSGARAGAQPTAVGVVRRTSWAGQRCDGWRADWYWR